MNTDGVPAMKFVRGAVNGDEFLDFIERDLLPTLMPFDGINCSSIVILDNCSVPGVVVGALAASVLARHESN